MLLMEIALQPCGLLGAYMGKHLTFQEMESISPNFEWSGDTFRVPTGTDLEERPSPKVRMVSSVATRETILQRHIFDYPLMDTFFYRNFLFWSFYSEAFGSAQQVALDNEGKFRWYSEQLQRD